MKKFMNITVGAILTILLISLNSLSAYEAKNIVMFDQGHGQRFLAERSDPLDLSKLAVLFFNDGFRGKICKGEITDQVLAEVDALIISGHFIPFTPSEISVISSFVKNGGRLCIMLHIGSPLTGLLHKMNIAVFKGIVHEQDGEGHRDDLDDALHPLAASLAVLEGRRDVEQHDLVGAIQFGQAGR